MMTLLKYEMVYNFKHYLLILMMPVIYTLVVLLNIPLLDNTQIVSKVLWPLFIGNGPIIYLGIIAAFYVKEGQLRKNLILPIKRNHVSIARTSIIVMPILVVLAYLVFVHLVILTEWRNITLQIIYYQGVYFLFLSSVTLSHELLFAFRKTLLQLRLLFGGLLILANIFVVYFGDQYLTSNQLGEFRGIIYLALAMIIHFVRSIVFSKRRSYLL